MQYFSYKKRYVFLTLTGIPKTNHFDYITHQQKTDFPLYFPPIATSAF